MARVAEQRLPRARKTLPVVPRAASGRAGQDHQPPSLDRSAGHLKDNRLPPRGFSTAGERDRDIAIVGAAATDEDFNRDGEREGTGRDVVTYRIDVRGAHGTLEVQADLLYQSFQSGFLEDLLSHDTPAVRRLERLFKGRNTTPETVETQRVTVRPGD